MPNSLSPGEGQDLLARIKQAREGRDPDMLVELFAEDTEYHYDPFEPPLVGANAIRRYWNGIAADQTDVEFDAERVWVVGRTVLSSWHSAHSLRSSTDRIRMRGFATMELDEAGRISRMREWPASRREGAGSTGS
jgi:hypothetical protein